MSNVVDYFQDLTDPRVDRTKLHRLSDIIGITLCGVLAGATGWDAIEDFVNARLSWLRKFLFLENGVPSADTIRRVISRIDPVEFQTAFLKWVNDIIPNVEGVVAIDGKTIRNKGTKNPLHLVSAWAEKNNGVCLAQVATEEKSNEITAIPTLLDYLDLAGCIVTIDAMGCQKEIARIIVDEKESDYCLAVKSNQKNLHQDLQHYFSDCDGSVVEGASRSQSSEINRGREEIRTAYISKDVAAIPSSAEWPSISTFGLVISNRTVKGKNSEERRYFISSADLSAKKLIETTRAHWGIENKLHWILDVVFKEDGNPIVKDHGQQNLATLRKFAINMLKAEPTKLSVKRKIFKASLDSGYMAKVLKLP